MPKLEAAVYWKNFSRTRKDLVVQGSPTVGVQGLLAQLYENTPSEYTPEQISQTVRFTEKVVTSLTNLLVKGGGITNAGGYIFADSFEGLGLSKNGETALLSETVTEGRVAYLQKVFGLDPENFGFDPKSHAYLIASSANSKIKRVDTVGGSAIFYICRADGSRSARNKGDSSWSLLQPFQGFAEVIATGFFPEEGTFPLVASRTLVNAILYDMSFPASF